MHTITLPSGRCVTVGSYVRVLRDARAKPATMFNPGLSGWPEYGRDIWNRFRSHTVDDIINQRGGLLILECDAVKVARKRARHVKLTCSWCGAPVTKTEPRDFYPGATVFCSRGCCASYNF